VAGFGLDDERAQLRATRELITRRGARRAALLGSVGALSHEIGALRQRVERARAAIAAQRDAARWQEEAQDRIVPRLVARDRALERRRGQAARALADLASLSRRRELAPELRARLSTIGPALLALLRSQDSVRVTLTRQHDRLTLRQDQDAARLPILRAEAARAQQQRQQLLDQRRRALSEIAGLDAALQRLARISVPLAQRLVVIEAAHRVDMVPHDRRPAHDPGGLRVAGASVRGHPLAWQDVAQAASPGAHARASVGVRRDFQLGPRLEPNLAVRLASLPTARPLARGHAPLPGAAASRLVPLAPVSSAMAMVEPSSRVAPARLAVPAPIRPSPEIVMARLDGADHATGVTIAAAPGQRVVAPRAGRIVFADAFKSYGLLLIIEHDSEYHTLLWGFSKLRVGVGDKVTDGEIIGVMDVVDGVRPRLGVELRRKGRPVNPLPWLAASSSKVRG
jgi:murein DD-endopeptidase MepM/ murein hydrolase activator NlpD